MALHSTKSGIDLICKRRSSYFVVAANRRSAVERLEETKANYVKTERVLDCKQNFEHSSNLHVSTGPQIDTLFKGNLKGIYNCQNIMKYVHGINLTDNKNSVQPIVSEFEPISCSTAITKCSEQENCFMQKKQLFQRDSYDESERPQTNPQKAQMHVKSNGGRHVLSHVMKFESPGINENVQAARMSFSTINPVDRFPQSSQMVPETDKNFPHFDSAEDKTEHSDYEQISIGASDDSSSVDEGLIEFEDKKQSSKTSDYVSRSSSFKCSLSSDRVKNLVRSFESRINKSSPSPTANLTVAECKKKSTSRSKSDCTSRFAKHLSSAPEPTVSTDAELERFFNSMGLENYTSQNATGLTESPVHFFESISSQNSEDHLSSAASEESAFEAPKEGLTNSDLKKHAPTETSIVEKNARIVKWLYNCRNAVKKNPP
ncbi:uncharacterized protein LOC129231066 [Uloborus diversus]|uniref:uncharacterized protein LOC129231066 n=1 Tax=Uloborus diversus TaxID=327109 RepID=UPI0024095897|nr:uncharacterized protein LOC129231066 [Uloborus diversus]